MKKTSLLILTLCLLAVLLTACGECEHQWGQASCDQPAACAKCGETQGAALGHSWMDATCDAPKTCSRCKATEGAALGHNWMDATCDAPKTCSVCGTTEGGRAEHQWQKATVNTPKTCEVCGTTEGDKLPDARFDPEQAAPLVGKWHCEYVVDGQEEIGQIPGVDLMYTAYIDFEFQKDGTLVMTVSFEEESYKRVMTAVLVEMFYRSYEAMGVSRAEADQMVQDTYGMDMQTYAKLTAENINMEDQTEVNRNVYYVQDGALYDSVGWDYTMDCSSITLKGDQLTLVDLETGTILTFTKVD